jgi:WXG100 family type VII secretion target
MSMDSSPILVAPELESVSNYLNTHAQEIADQLNRLAAYVRTLEQVWQGDAYQYYHGLQMEWKMAADGLFAPDGVLGSIASAMNITWHNYADAEQSNTQTWRHS